MFVYSLLDLKAKEYGHLVVGRNDELVKRALVEGFEQARNSTMGRYPEDYLLMCLGRFDLETGVLVGFAPVPLGTLREVVEGGFNGSARAVSVVEDLGERADSASRKGQLSAG